MNFDPPGPKFMGDQNFHDNYFMWAGLDLTRNRNGSSLMAALVPSDSGPDSSGWVNIWSV